MGLRGPKPQKQCIDCNSLLEDYVAPTNGGGKRMGRRCTPCYHKHQSNKRQALKRRAVEHLGDKCAHCNQSFPDECYDFHHLSDKKHDVGKLTHATKKWETILEEINKCILLCANCHRIHHYNNGSTIRL